MEGRSYVEAYGHGETGIPSEVAFSDPPIARRKIAICGFATESLWEAPFDDPDCEIWILNMLHGHVPRWDRLFELHDRPTVEQENAEKEEQRKRERGGLPHLDYLRTVTDRPIYMVEPWDDVPCGVRFPVEVVAGMLGAHCGKIESQPYFTSTFAYMLAWAVRGIIHQRAHPWLPEEGEEIHVCGVEMLNGEEYAYQRSNAEFLCGWALGHGIQLFIPERSALLESDGLYGYAKPNTLELLSHQRGYYLDKKQKAQALRLEAERQLQQARAEWNTADGSRQAFESLLALAPGLSGPALAEKLTSLVAQAVAARDAAAVSRDHWNGQANRQQGVVDGLDWVVNHLLYLSRGGKT